MHENTISTKVVVMGTVIAGLVLGMVMGFTQIINTSVATADEQSRDVEGAIGVGLTDKAATQAQLNAADTAVRAAQEKINGQSGEVTFVEIQRNPYITDGTDEKGREIHTKQVLTYIGDGGLIYTADRDTGKIMQIGPAPRRSESDPAPSRDYTERYTKDELAPLAVAFAEDLGVDVDAVTKGLKMQVFTKDGTGYFFRWEDTSNPNEMRFLQVGLTVGGSLLSYVNTLEI